MACCSPYSNESAKFALDLYMYKLDLTFIFLSKSTTDP